MSRNYASPFLLAYNPLALTFYRMLEDHTFSPYHGPIGLEIGTLGSFGGFLTIFDMFAGLFESIATLRTHVCVYPSPWAFWLLHVQIAPPADRSTISDIFVSILERSKLLCTYLYTFSMPAWVSTLSGRSTHDPCASSRSNETYADDFF